HLILDNNTFILASHDRTLYKWNIKTNELLENNYRNNTIIRNELLTCMTLYKDKIIMGSSNGSLFYFDKNLQLTQFHYQVHSNMITEICAAEDEVISSTDSDINAKAVFKITSYTTGLVSDKQIDEDKIPNGIVASIQMCDNKIIINTQGSTNETIIFDMVSKKHIKSLSHNGVKWSEIDSGYLLLRNEEMELDVMNLHNSKRTKIDPTYGPNKESLNVGYLGFTLYYSPTFFVHETDDGKWTIKNQTTKSINTIDNMNIRPRSVSRRGTLFSIENWSSKIYAVDFSLPENETNTAENVNVNQ
ncbi:MAG: hypothetical protein JHC93_07010, partial [Parachlamydiales bacterium]|nr:hypothetical protein [Parachlamydiales bacterium]